MTSKTKKASAAFGSAVVLASGAYALGTQAGDGSASAGTAKAAAAKSSSGSARRRDCGLDGLASRLKVDPAKLRQALKEIRTERKADGGPAKELAAALDLPVQRVRDALKKLRAQRRDDHADRRDDFLTAVAKSLGISEEKVRTALDELGPGRGRPHGPDFRRRESLSAAAKKLGVGKAKLRAALRDARPGLGRESRRGGPDDAFAADLAKALGLSTEKVRSALAKLESTHDDRRAELARKLADKLAIPESRVKSALAEHRPGGPRGFRHGGPPHGGPGDPPPGPPMDHGFPPGSPPGP